MRPRQEIIELFSTFLQIEADHFSRWVSDLRLRRSMQRGLEGVSKREAAAGLDSPAGEKFWVLYWHHSWQSQDNALAKGHLSAYLQEPCYWAAQRIARKFASVQFGVADYFQLAMAEVQTVLKNFKPDRGANLKTFASIAFPSLLKDMLRQRQEANLCTNLGLLRRISKKRLLEVLRQVGLAAPAIAHYQLAWVCFNAVYVPIQTGSNQLPAVDSALWHAVAALYNSERRNQLDPSVPEATPETIERWLNQCATWVRAYLYPPVQSLNVPKAGLESGGEIQDDLVDPLQDSLLANWVAQEDDQERQDQRSQMRQQLVAAIATLDAQSQELLRLYYQQGLTQQQMMQQLKMSQATVSRRLTKSREAVLMALVHWSQTTLHNSPTPTLIKDMSAALEEWLEAHYGGSNHDSSSDPAAKEVEE